MACGLSSRCPIPSGDVELREPTPVTRAQGMVAAQPSPSNMPALLATNNSTIHKVCQRREVVSNAKTNAERYRPYGSLGHHCGGTWPWKAEVDELQWGRGNRVVFP